MRNTLNYTRGVDGGAQRVTHLSAVVHASECNPILHFDCDRLQLLGHELTRPAGSKRLYGWTSYNCYVVSACAVDVSGAQSETSAGSGLQPPSSRCDSGCRTG